MESSCSQRLSQKPRVIPGPPSSIRTEFREPGLLHIVFLFLLLRGPFLHTLSISPQAFGSSPLHLVLPLHHHHTVTFPDIHGAISGLSAAVQRPQDGVGTPGLGTHTL